MSKTQEELERGAQAQYVLENSAFLSAFDLVNEGIKKTWEQEKEPAERERLWLMLQVSQKYRTALISTVTTGRLAADQIAREQKNLMQRLFKSA
jgi:hypothetical protein